MAHFYLTLPSNSSSKYYHDNTLTRFNTKLHSGISLSGDWEVGLNEIIFPHTWLTVDETDATFTLSCEGYVIQNVVGVAPYTVEVRIPRGYYESVRDVVREINESFSKMNPMPGLAFRSSEFALATKEKSMMPELKYDESSKRVEFAMNRNQSLSFPSGLAAVLGVDPKQNPSTPEDEETFAWIGANVSDITRGINYMMVYCDLLEHVPVGDTKVPLLRIVDAKGENGEIIHRSYDEPRYVPLQKKNFDSIEMDLRDDLGKPIAFENGKLVVTLHFRQAKRPYFLG